ncbi:MAG: PspC domain-containing protein [Chloroflexota bacterium]
MSKLYRSRADAMVAGVSGGLGQYFGVDSTFVRLVFVLLLFAEGIGALLYLVMALVVPRIPEGQEENILPAVPISENPLAMKAAGGGLVLFGIVVLIDNLNIRWLRWIDFDILWPILLIAAGGVLLARVLKS